MSMHLIMGGSGSGKTEHLCHTIIEESIRHPEKQYLVIVPEQATLQTQKLYVDRHPRKGLLNIDVLSFQRLAHRVLEETGAEEKIVLRDTGKNLLLRKAAGDISEELTVFARNFRRIGYVSEMKSLLSELAQYRIDGETIQEMLKVCPKHSSLYGKLKDIAVLQERFRKLLGEKYVTNEELLDRLAQYVPKSGLLKEAVLAFDGFTGFTPVQESLLETLFAVSSDLYFTVEMSYDADPEKQAGPYDLFHLSREMLKALKRLAYETHTEIAEPVIRMPEDGPRYEQAPELRFLEQNLFRRKPGVYVKDKSETDNTDQTGMSKSAPGEMEAGETVVHADEEVVSSISIHTNRNPMEEARFLASEIRRLVKEENYRYRDLAVTVSNMDTYGPCLSVVFDELQIPYFMDQKRNALGNAAVEYVRAAVSMVEERMSYKSVFRFLKSGFSDMDPEDLYLMENYVLAMDVKGFSHWEERWIRKPKSLTEEEVLHADALRGEFMESMQAFLDAMRKRGRTVRSCTTALYELLASQQIQKKLERKKEWFEEHEEPALGREYAQVYRLLMEMFDEFVSLLGEEQVGLDEYRELLDAGLAELRVGVIPPGQDQVLIGDLERSRVSNIRALFVAGLNDLWLPGISETGGILNDRDREFLARKEYRLAPTQMEKIATQRYYLYLNLTKPSRHLYLSYSHADMEGKTIQPTFYLREITKLFDKVPVYQEADTILTRDLSGSETDALRYLANGLNNRNALSDPVWKQLYSWYRSHAAGDRVQEIVDAAFLHNKQESLTKERAREIFGTLLRTSISRLEKYAVCPYAHFLTYGLQLTEREEYEFAYVDEGNLLHEALYRLGQILKRSGYSWKKAPEEVLHEACEKALADAVFGYGNAILSSTARRQYMVKRMEEKLIVSADVLQEQLRLSVFEPAEYELHFGRNGVPAIALDLGEKTKLLLSGQIDRVDVAEDGQGRYVKIMDYKTGEKKMDLSAVYHGLDLQLFLYLKAAQEYIEQTGSSDVHPAGVMYFQLQNPLLKQGELPEGADESDIRAQVMETMKPSGILNSDENVIHMMDLGFYDREEAKSPVLPLKKKADGGLYKDSPVLSEQEFALMEKHLLQKVKETGSQILDGDISVTPVKHPNKKSCEHCTYNQICGFDSNTPGYEERELEKLSIEDITLKLHAKEGQDA